MNNYSCTVPALDMFGDIKEDVFLQPDEIPNTMRMFLQAHNWPSGETKFTKIWNSALDVEEYLVYTKAVDRDKTSL